MATRTSEYLILFLLSLIVCSSGTYTKEILFHSSRRELVSSLHYKATEHDLVDPPTTIPVTNSVTTPGFVPQENAAPTIITVPATNPVATTPNPISTPTNPVPPPNPVSPTVPVTNPVTTPSTNPGGQPVSNPVTSPTPSGGVPATTPITNPNQPPVTTNAPAISGQSWCVAKSGMQETALQSAIDYACGMGGADCSAIQHGGMCYNPNSLQNHASFAFNSYYQKNPTQTSCDFGGIAMITNINPSTGSCVYPITSSTSSSPATSSTPSGATTPGSGTPTVINAGNSTSGGTSSGFGEIPPTASTSTSKSNKLEYFGCITLVVSIVTGIIVI